MHELSLAERALQIVEHAAQGAGMQCVTRITLVVGELAHVDADTLRYCCELVARGTCAEAASIRIERKQGQGVCKHCSNTVALSHIGQPCPNCGSHDLRIDDGDQLQVLEIASTQMETPERETPECA